MTTRRITLGHVFYLSLLGLTLLLGALFTVLLEGSRRSIVKSSEQLREAFSDRIDDEVLRGLRAAEKALLDLEREIRSGTCEVEEPLSLEASLFSVVLNNPDLSEVTLTHAPRPGSGEGGPVWQISVFREDPDAGSPIVTRRTAAQGGRFVSELRSRPPDGGLFDTPLRRQPGAAPDPTQDPTFTTPAEARYGHLVWTDISWSPIDAHLPDEQRRTVLTAMKTVEDRGGRFLGVLRVGSRAEQIDRVAQMRLDTRGGEDPHVKFLFDGEGRLVTRLSPDDRLYDAGDALRVTPAMLPPEVALALSHPMHEAVSAENPRASGEIEVGGRRFLVSFRSLADAARWQPEGGIEDWRIGIVVPEEAYLGDLEKTRNVLLGSAAVVIAVILGGGALTLGAVRRGLARIEGETKRMRCFDFAPSPTDDTPFADVREAVESLELAKTAMRAMGKYVPVALVRELYEANREPTLGGCLQDASLMFTDIEGFTTLAEGLTPDRLAAALGLYLEAMTAAVHQTGGTVDKYIGDAVMALWNAPRPLPGHTERACQAALACIAATQRLFASPAWSGLPPLVTRFGLHRATVMVGHFGAPDRFSYTALGDGVNLASRLEGLNKQYGTRLMASEAAREAAGASFAFRRLDRVAVKGKTQGTLVYELLGEAGQVPEERLRAARAYEAALEAYFAGDFAAALAGFEQLDDDGPGRVLAARCRMLQAEPPPAAWDGIFVARSK